MGKKSIEDGRRDLIEQVLRGLEGLLLTDRISDEEKRMIVEQMFAICNGSKIQMGARVE